MTKNIILSHRLNNFSISFSFLGPVMLVVISDGVILYFMYLSIMAYSTIAKRVKIRHDRIQYTMAVGCPPDLGEFTTVAFRRLIMQRTSVNKNPILPGTVSTGRRKLI